jgi:hypothetical protein
VREYTYLVNWVVAVCNNLIAGRVDAALSKEEELEFQRQMTAPLAQTTKLRRLTGSLPPLTGPLSPGPANGQSPSMSR